MPGPSRLPRRTPREREKARQGNRDARALCEAYNLSEATRAVLVDMLVHGDPQRGPDDPDLATAGEELLAAGLAELVPLAELPAYLEARGKDLTDGPCSQGFALGLLMRHQLGLPMDDLPPIPLLDGERLRELARAARAVKAAGEGAGR